MNTLKLLVYLTSISLVLIFNGQAIADNALKPVVRERILTQLETAQKQIDKKRFKQSFELLNKLSRTKLSAYESSQVYQMLAFQFYQQNKPRDAIRYYEKILKLKQLPGFTIKQTRYNLGQLYFSVEEHKLARNVLKKWFEENVSAGMEAYELYGQINYLLEDYPAAIKAINTAISKREKSKKLPKQNLLQLLQAMYYELGNLQATREVLQHLIQHYPKKIYWLQLASLYAELKDPKQQLAILDTAYLQGHLNKESELKTLAYLYLEFGTPYKAAKVLEKGLGDRFIASSEKNLVLFANTWRQAKETRKTIAVLQRAAKLSKNGNLDAEVAQLYLFDNQYENSISAGKKALSKLKLKSPASVYLMQGISYYKLNQFENALASLAKIKSGQSEAKSASQWKNHIQRVSNLK
ncbi:MAG: tetratricopeptide (TPR) repeat protein [Gammaproteobacteria bacterium]